jgi:Zinc knuckle
MANVPVQQDFQCSCPKGPCFNCRKMGHFAKDCHSNPSSNINYMDTVDNNMQYVPQPNTTSHANVAQLKAQIDALSTEDNDALIEAMIVTAFYPSLIRSALVRQTQTSNVFISNRKSMTIRTFLHMRSKRAEAITLLDSGATENFMNLEYTKYL